MKLTTTRTDDIPLLTCGEDSDKAFLFVHGLCGSKEEAIRFAEIAGKHGCLTFAREHPVRALCETDILYGSRDELIPRKVIDSFVENNPCRLTVIDSEHWIHTPEAIARMSAWEDEALR